MDGNTGFTLPSKVYDFFKWVALVILPAVGTLYAALGSLWDFPAVVQVVGTIAAIDTFLGMLLKRSSSNYQDTHAQTKLMGDFIVKVDADGNAAGMRIEANQEFVPHEGDVIGFRVKRSQALE